MNRGERILFFGLFIMVALIVLITYICYGGSFVIGVAGYVAAIIVVGAFFAKYEIIAGFFKKMFGKVSRGRGPIKGLKEIKDWDGTVKNTTITVNGRYDPETRISLEKYLGQIVEKYRIGKVLGGKCFYKERMEVEHCEVYLSLRYDDPRFINNLADFLNEHVPLPRGSLIQGPRSYCAVGNMGGMAIYVTLSMIPYSEEAQADFDALIKRIHEGLGKMYFVKCCWNAANDVNYTMDEAGREEYHKNNPQVFAMYFYGAAFVEMKSVVEPLVKDSIFFEASKIVQCS